MRRDEDVLRELNVRIGVAESEGDREFLDAVLAPVLAFRRANGAFVDRAGYLEGVKESPKRDTEIGSVDLGDGDERKRFHNVRLFVRAGDGAWQLLAWANEPG
jgi:hypothetical protein